MKVQSNSPQVDAIHKLFLKHAAELRGFILALLPDSELAGDVLHDVFLLVTAKADSFQEGTNFLAWTKSMVRLKVLEAARARRVGSQWLSVEVIEGLCDSMPEQAVDDCRLDAIRICLQQLPQRAKTLVDLRYRLECKPAEIARRIGWQARSVYVELSRARDMLRQCLQKKLKLQEDIEV